MYSTAELAKRMAALITVFVTDLVAATFLFLQLKGGKWREMVRNLAGFNARGRAFFASCNNSRVIFKIRGGTNAEIARKKGRTEVEGITARETFNRVCFRNLN